MAVAFRHPNAAHGRLPAAGPDRFGKRRAIIVVTAFDEHAIRAFDVEAVDSGKVRVCRPGGYRGRRPVIRRSRPAGSSTPRCAAQPAAGAGEPEQPRGLNHDLVGQQRRAVAQDQSLGFRDLDRRDLPPRTYSRPVHGSGLGSGVRRRATRTRLAGSARIAERDARSRDPRVPRSDCRRAACPSTRPYAGRARSCAWALRRRGSRARCARVLFERCALVYARGPDRWFARAARSLGRGRLLSARATLTRRFDKSDEPVHLSTRILEPVGRPRARGQHIEPAPVKQRRQRRRQRAEPVQAFRRNCRLAARPGLKHHDRFPL